jgi:release factor glutamine methyltransferase
MPDTTPADGSGFRFDATLDQGADRKGGGTRSTRDVLYDAQRRLTAAGVPSPKADADWLMSWVLDVPRNRLILQDELTSQQRMAFEKALARRLSRVPLQHIVGRAAFRRIDLGVGPGVFIPRPETEVVTEAAIRHARQVDAPVVVDLCAGSGAIGLSVAIEVPGARVRLVEVGDEAIEWTRRNVAEHERRLVECGSVVEVIHADAGVVADPGGALVDLVGAVDVVVSNPPYIPDSMVPREVEVRDHDPALALFGGASGMDVIERVLRTAALLLRPGGMLVVEHADVQGPDAIDGGVVGLVRSMILDEQLASMVPGRPGVALFESATDRLDLAGLPRFTMATRSTA